MRLLREAEELWSLRDKIAIADHFLWYITAHQWASLAADSGASVAATDAKGGILAITTGATDNNEAAVATAQEVFLLGADRPMFCECLLAYTEPGTNEGNVAFGLADALGANLIADDGASVGVANTGILIYKLDGGTVWRCYSECNGSTSDTASIHTAGGSAQQRLGFEVLPVDGSNVEITFFLDGAPMLDSNYRPIKHRRAFASATEMDLGVYAKTGATAATLVVNLDYLAGLMLL